MHLVLLSLLFLAALVIGLVLILGAILNGEWIGAVVVLVDVAGLFGVLMLAPSPLLRFTDQGVELRRQLSGLRAYIRMAEQDRLRMLQSPQGALRTTAGDPIAQSALDRYVLTERLLPMRSCSGRRRPGLASSSTSAARPTSRTACAALAAHCRASSPSCRHL